MFGLVIRARSCPLSENVFGLCPTVLYSRISSGQFFLCCFGGKWGTLFHVKVIQGRSHQTSHTVSGYLLTLSLLSSKSTFSRPFKEKMHK